MKNLCIFGQITTEKKIPKAAHDRQEEIKAIILYSFLTLLFLPLTYVCQIFAKSENTKNIQEIF